ncbi:MAG: hypothetical protein RLZZ423_1175 [Cyanobacteriota bacterium]|jgi:hypothetical protein
MSQGGMRDTLRLAGTVMVVNGFASLTGITFATYASLAVLSVTVGNYGNTLELGRQRLIGTLLGAIVVFFAYRAWGQLPVMVALPLALLLVRALAAWLRLTVGYGVSCFVVIMGWLSHEHQLESWITLRLFWTAFGVLLALLSLRLFWPSRARMQQRLGLLQLLVDLGTTMQTFVGQQPQQRRALGAQLRSLRSELLSLRDQRQSALLELGSLAEQHPVARLWDLLDQACETLILDLDELRRLPTPHWQSWGLEAHHQAALRFSAAVGERLLRWQQVLGSSMQLRLPPAEAREHLDLEALLQPSHRDAFAALSPQQLEQVATRLMVLHRIDQTLAETERAWQSLVR